MNTFVIAEVGSNWESIEDCREAIVKAKQSGADAVKFQLYSWNELYGSRDSYMPETDELKWAMPREWIPLLAEKAKATGIEFMCTAFSPEGYKFIDPFVRRHKVASSEMCHKRILETLRELGKPVILSTGAQTLPDIKYALDVLSNVPVTVLYCEGSYPAKWTDLNNILSLTEETGCPVGYSDHTLSIIDIPRLAARLGAKVIEKHFKTREMNTPDSPHSILPHEFKAMTQAIRDEWSSRIGPTPDELSMITTHKRRLIAIKDIKTGELLKEGENFGIFRSLKAESKALHPFLIDQVDGKRAKVEIQAGDGIGPSDIE